jgi:5-methylcytosine-specific restriction protein A
MRQVTLIIGPPCSGKTTWVQHHAQPGDLIIDWDQLAIQAGSPVPHDHPAAYRAAASTERTRLEHHVATTPNITAWIIRTLPNPKDQHKAEQRLHTTHTHICDPGMTTCIRRAQQDGRPPDIDQTIVTWYATRAGARLNPTQHNGKHIRSTRTWQRITKTIRRQAAANNTPCGICGKPIRYDLHAPNPQSFSVDHITPIANGGAPYDLHNLQPAHLGCNAAKSNKNLDTHRVSETW